MNDRRATIGAVTDPVQDSALLRACRREPVPYTPVWFMRQAGRSLPEYRAARAGVGMLEACSRPELVAELTLQPVRRYGVDAAILFSDIVVPLRAAGVDLDIEAGVGPVVARPVRDARGGRTPCPTWTRTTSSRSRRPYGCWSPSWAGRR